MNSIGCVNKDPICQLLYQPAAAVVPTPQGLQTSEETSSGLPVLSWEGAPIGENPGSPTPAYTIVISNDPNDFSEPVLSIGQVRADSFSLDAATHQYLANQHAGETLYWTVVPQGRPLPQDPEVSFFDLPGPNQPAVVSLEQSLAESPGLADHLTRSSYHSVMPHLIAAGLYQTVASVEVVDETL